VRLGWRARSGPGCRGCGWDARAGAGTRGGIRGLRGGFLAHKARWTGQRAPRRASRCESEAVSLPCRGAGTVRRARREGAATGKAEAGQDGVIRAREKNRVRGESFGGGPARQRQRAGEEMRGTASWAGCGAGRPSARIGPAG